MGQLDLSNNFVKIVCNLLIFVGEFMFRKKQSLGLRVWHWANSGAIFLLLITVILRKTFLSVRGNTPLIVAKAQEVGAVLTDSQATDIAKALRSPMWQWHPIIGLVAIALLIFRFIIYLQNRASAPDVSKKPLQYKIVKKSHSLFYVILGVMGVSGVLLYWSEAFGLSTDFNHTVKEVHEFLMWFFVVFVIAHIVGVVKSELGEDRGLVSDMINGGKDL